MHPCSPSEEARKYGKKDIPKDEGEVEEEETRRRKLLEFAESFIPRRSLATKGYDKCAEKGKVAFVSAYGMHQLHIFIFILAVCHVLYCIVTYALGKTKMRRWKRWEEETKTIEYQYTHDPERFRFARDTSFGRRHLNIWSKTTITLWINAFQLAFFAWSTYEFGLKNCFHESSVDVIIRISIGLIVQFLCSYVTLPLYALVTQMGSNMKPTVFNERVATALKSWHHTAKKQLKHGRTSESTTPFSSRPTTPTHGSSPIHLLRNGPHTRSRSADYSFANSLSPRKSDFDSWDPESQHDTPETSTHGSRFREEESEKRVVDASSSLPPGPEQIRTEHALNISLRDFSFKR